MSAGRDGDGLRAWLWRALGAPLFRLSPHPAYGFRRRLLRAFGARVTSRTKVRRTVRIAAPWNVSLGALTVVGDHARLVARGAPITVGDRCVVSQLAMLVTDAAGPGGAGDARTVAPIVVEDDAWVATDVLVLPGSVVRAGAVVGARGTVDGELPPWSVCVGRPAVKRGERVLREVAA